MSDDTRLDLLVDLFPAVARSELVARLSSCDNFDNLVELLLTESHLLSTNNDAPTVPQDIHQNELQFMFPHIDQSKIAETLKKNNNNFQDAANALMEPNQPQTPSLVDLCGLPPQTTDPYVEKYRGDETQALIVILATFSNRNNLRTVKINGDSSGQKHVPLYVFKSSSQEAMELDWSILQNKQLQKLNYLFLKRLLVFFHGNVDKVLAAAVAIVGAQRERFTFDSSLGLSSESVAADKPSISEVIRAGPSKTIDIQTFLVPTKRNTNMSTKTPTNATKTLPAVSSKIDLHGYLVSEAVEAAEEAVDSWWHEEMRLREEEGQFGKYGRKCHFLEPLSIVTGRGIHSQGGPKIRGLVIRMLTRKGFQYDDDVGRLLVIGKK